VQAGGQAAAVALTVTLVPALGLAGVGTAAILGAALAAVGGLAVLRRTLGVRLRAVRAALTVAVLGWLGAAVLWTSGATGWLEALGAAAVVVAVQLRQLGSDERRWLGDRLRRAAPELRR
jgi:hypothetical protein